MMIYTFVLIIAVLCTVMAFIEAKAKKAEEDHVLDMQAAEHKINSLEVDKNKYKSLYESRRSYLLNDRDYWRSEHDKVKKEHDLLKNYGQMYDDLKKENDELRNREG